MIQSYRIHIMTYRYVSERRQDEKNRKIGIYLKK